MTYDLKKLKDKASIIWLNLNRIRKLIPAWVSLILLFVFGLLVSPYLAEYVSLLAQRRFSAQELHYEISSISLHKKYELFSLSNAEGLSEFNLGLDDPILADYYLVKVRLRNDGKAIKSSLKFNVTIGKNYTKILDIKHKVIKPTNKSFKIIHSLPPLTWEMHEDIRGVTLAWSYELATVAGFHVYRSVLKNEGYGRINERMVTQPQVEIQLNNLSTCYYRVTAIGFNGMESKSNDPIRFPDSAAFLPLFKDVYWVNPDTVSENAADGTRKAPFRSLSEGIERKGKSATFLVEQSREEVTSIGSLSKKARVFYKGDLRFLNGWAQVSLLDGMDEGTEIELFFLCKMIPEKVIDLNMKLEGAPEIRFKKGETQWRHRIQLKNEAGSSMDPKVLLTPREVKTYLGEGTIYLVWEKPKSSAYKGVRIFRSGKRSADDLTNFGQELYDGPGCSDKLERVVWTKNSIEPDRLKRFRHSIDYSYVSPPQKKSAAPPLPPTGFGIRGIEVISELDDDLLHFADNSVSSSKAYTYTLWAYGNNYTYSYQIVINASLSDWSPEDNCYPKVR